eukprot:TRINITY_DN11648_c0_g1_i1.p1 TRINITY_DN11648_c0_g1~~TRINITY_DN11648_c0_g1_i1.p1  ORF type:complete len:307 (-),score=109.54 TRINITY_DN11648_c0_g1_i1:153-1073(-)
MQAMLMLRRGDSRRRSCLLPAAGLAATAVLLSASLLQVVAPVFLNGCRGLTARGSRSDVDSPVQRLAKKDDFSYTGKKKGGGRGFSDKSKALVKKDEDDEEEEDEATQGASITMGASKALAKKEREERGGALSTTKLQDLRDKTLVLRQKREAELDEYEEGKALIAKYGPEVGVMPKKVAERTAKRGMVIGGSFYAVMLAVVAGGIILFKTTDLIIPPAMMAFVTLALLVMSVLGSSYGMMSASWDPDREGSLLGTEEFSKNMGIIGEGLRRASVQNEYEKAIEGRKERKLLLEAKEEKKRELLNE